jgi:hypothetical protein
VIGCKDHTFLPIVILCTQPSTFVILTLYRAGKSGSKQAIEQCTQQCQMPYQRAGAVTQQEISNFQNRLNRSMGQCQDDVQSMITPDMQNDDKKMKKVEESLVKCLAGAIEKSREGLKPMRQRIESQLN